MLKDMNLHVQIEPIVKLVGQLQLSYFAQARSLQRQEKDGAGFVTEADLASEQLLIKNLSQVIPGADFYAEESGVSGNGDYRWVIDPLDGTTNFAHGLPYFCISVALTYKDEVLFGMIYQPVLNELFWAQKGRGAWLNGDRISVAHPEKLDKSLLVVALPYQDSSHDPFLKKVCSIVSQAFAFRHVGASALDLAYVACGRFDCMFFSGLAWWDFAAGDLLIREAGGQSSDFKGNQIGITSQSGIFGNVDIHQALIHMIKS